MSEIFTDWLAKPYVLLIKTCHPERSEWSPPHSDGILTCTPRAAGRS